MKARCVFVLSVVFFATTLTGFSQASWSQPESMRKIFGSNSANAAQLMRISAMMTTASVIAPINADLAKQQAANAEEQVTSIQSQGSSDFQSIMKQLIDSIRKFLMDLQKAQEQQQTQTITRA